ncbi:MAG: glycerophosphodiester phosphodiesterase [Microthrixaceae bacterium]
MPLHSFYDQRFPIAVAHRGGMESAPENTFAAFRAAYDLGFRHLETDVHVTADGVLIAFHDDALDRVTDRSGTIRELPWSEVSAALIGGTEPIPTLDQLLEEFPDIWFNIDAKSDDAVVALAAALRRHGAIARVCAGSFSDERLRRLRSLLGPELCTAASPPEVTQLVATAQVSARTRRQEGPDEGPRRGVVPRPYQCVQVPVRHGRVTIVTPELVRAAHRRGCHVHVWTIDDPTEMHRLLDLGVDGIMTDRPSVLREVLLERGQWR